VSHRSRQLGLNKEIRMSQRRTYNTGYCKQCGGPFTKKPASKEFCRRLCKDQYHNNTRGRVTIEAALEWIEQHLVTIRQAAEMGLATDAKIRAMVRKQALKPRRLFGRILLRRADIERIIK
jgi:hypothetical protein